MWKWFCSFALIASAIVPMAYEQHHAREKYQIKSQADCVVLAVSIEEKHSCAKEAQSRKDYAPWWYVLVTWPEGITTWAIIATGCVIAWQSNETRRAAKATQEQAKIANATLVAQFRPRIVVRQMRLDPPSVTFYERRNDGKWKIIMQLANVGGTDATIMEGTGYFQEYWGNQPNKDLAPWWILGKPIRILPGARSDIEYSLPAERFSGFMRSLEFSTAAKQRQPNRAPVFHGSIRYVDEIGITRETGFGRQWDVVNQRFVPIDDPTWEYQD